MAAASKKGSLLTPYSIKRSHRSPSAHWALLGRLPPPLLHQPLTQPPQTQGQVPSPQPQPEVARLHTRAVAIHTRRQQQHAAAGNQPAAQPGNGRVSAGPLPLLPPTLLPSPLLPFILLLPGVGASSLASCSCREEALREPEMWPGAGCGLAGTGSGRETRSSSCGVEEATWHVAAARVDVWRGGAGKQGVGCGQEEAGALRTRTWEMRLIQQL